MRKSKDYQYLGNTSPSPDTSDYFGTFEDSTTNDAISNFSNLDLESYFSIDEVFETHLVVEDKTLCQKYRPKGFDEIVCQENVVQLLNSAIKKDRVAPAYIFYGPCGTGKTSTARIFAAALNCRSNIDKKPCWSCKACKSFAIRRRKNMKEVVANNKIDVGKWRHLLKKLPATQADSKYQIFVIDECHRLSFSEWASLTKFVEQPIPRFVLIFLTVKSDSLPQVVVSRCQKFRFKKIKNASIISKLIYISREEDLDVERNALELIASNSKGSLGDAETILDQLSLLGKKITTWLLKDVLGLILDKELLQLLEVALSSNTAETLKMSRELMETGADPVAIISQLAELVMDIISGTYGSTKSQIFPITEAVVKRLHRFLKVLSDSEIQLRSSGERSTTCFTAALLQLCSINISQPSPLCSHNRNIKKLDNSRLDNSSLIVNASSDTETGETSIVSSSINSNKENQSPNISAMLGDEFSNVESRGSRRHSFQNLVGRREGTQYELAPNLLQRVRDGENLYLDKLGYESVSPQSWFCCYNKYRKAKKSNNVQH